MKTVEVVIKINKNTFDAVNELSKFVDGNHIINGYQMKGNSTVGSMITALAKGTVLPKGHDDLIERAQVTNYDNLYDVPTVIEADKAESEERNERKADKEASEKAD